MAFTVQSGLFTYFARAVKWIWGKTVGIIVRRFSNIYAKLPNKEDRERYVKTNEDLTKQLRLTSSTWTWPHSS